MRDVLEQFKADVNSNARISSMIQDWDPVFFVEESDTGRSYQLILSEGKICSIIESTVPAGEPALLVCAPRATLYDIFSGKLNPMRAYSNGAVELYGEHRDQSKLDAICLLLWGI